MSRPLIDFGTVAGDYARHRPGFPDVFFDHVARYGIGVPEQRVLDLGTGTGTLARGFAERGCAVVGLDPSAEMLHEAVALSDAAGLRVHYVRAWAEATGLRSDTCDVVCAGQCWHWMNRARAAAEAARVLRAGGAALIAYFTYLSEPGTPGAPTEELVLRHNPTWQLAGSDGRVPSFAEDLTEQGLTHADTFEFDTDIILTHAAWRGRMRACNGVFALPPDAVGAFDADLTAMLRERYADPFPVPHRIFGIVARKERAESSKVKVKSQS